MTRLVPVEDPFANDKSIVPVEGYPQPGQDFDWMGAIRQTLQGMTLGGADEAGAAVAAIPAALTSDKSIPEAYRDIHETLGHEQEQFEEANPNASTALELAGGLATGGAVGAKLAAMPILSGLSPLQQAAVIGATEGGTYGALSADPGERLSKGATSAVAGGVAAPTLAGGMSLVGHVGAPVVNRAKHAVLGTPRGDARRVLADTLADEGIRSIDDLGGQAARFSPTLADTSQGAKYLAAGLAADVDNPAVARQVEQTLGRRNRELTQRAFDALDEGIDVPVGASFKQAVDAVKQNRSQVAQRLYGEAESIPVNPTTYMKAMFSKRGPKEVRAALRKAEEAVGASRAAGDVVTHFTLLDEWKKNLDDIIEVNLRQGRRRRARDLVRIKNRIMDEIDEQNPAYKRARDAFAGDSKLIDAGERGKRILLEDLDELDGIIQGLSESEKVMYRLGARKAIREKLMAGREGTQTLNRISSQLNLAKIRKAFPSDEAFKQFKSEIDAEAAAFETYRLLMQNSKTAMTQMAQARIAGHKPPSVETANLVSEGIQKIIHPGLSKEAKNELGMLILTPLKDLPPEVLRDIEKRVVKQAGKEVGPFVRELMDAMFFTPAAAGAVVGQETANAL